MNYKNCQLAEKMTSLTQEFDFFAGLENRTSDYNQEVDSIGRHRKERYKGEEP